MAKIRYCTPEWLEESARLYPQNPKFKQEFSKLVTKIFFKINTEPTWGIEPAIIFGAFVDKGELKKLGFFSEQDAKQEADFILAASPQEWKKILRKENKFVGDFMLGKITLEQGSKVGVLSIAPHSTTFVETLTQFDLQFPDEMTPEELEEYRAYHKEFRQKLGV